MEDGINCMNCVPDVVCLLWLASSLVVVHLAVLRSHIFVHEGAGPSVLFGVGVCPIANNDDGISRKKFKYIWSFLFMTHSNVLASLFVIVPWLEARACICT